MKERYCVFSNSSVTSMLVGLVGLIDFAVDDRCHSPYKLALVLLHGIECRLA